MTEIVLLNTSFYIFVVFFIAVVDRRFSFFNPLFWYLAFHGLAFVYRPAIFHFYDFDHIFYYIGYYPTETDEIVALLVSNLGLMGFILGYAVSNSMTREGVISSSDKFLGDIDWQIFKRSTYLMLLVLLPPVLYSSMQGLQGFTYTDGSGRLMEMVDGISINVDSSGYVSDLKKALTTIVFILCLARRFDAVSIAVILIYVVYRLYLGWGRIHLVALLVELLSVYLILNYRRWPGLKVIVFVFLFVPIFTFIGQNRDYIKGVLDGEVVSVKVAEKKNFFERQDTLDFGNYEYLVYIVSVVPDHSQTYSYWTQYLQLFTEPVPRVLWPGKPIGDPMKKVDLMEHGNFTGLTRSSVGDGWISLGWFGVLINMFLIGFLLTVFFRLGFSRRRGFSPIYYLVTMPYLMQLFRDGGVVSITKFLVFAFLPILVTHYFYSILNRRRESV